MTMLRVLLPLTLAAAAPLAIAAGQEPASPTIPGPDAPELAALGSLPVGTSTIELVQPGQLDALQGADKPAKVDRHLTVRLWYPAAADGPPITYRTPLPGEDGKDVLFTVPGVAAENVAVARGRFPLVILAHGYSNSPEVLAWLGENLASKGYIVAVPAFRDPAISIRTDAARAGPLSRRPLDIAFVASEAARLAGRGEGVFAAADVSRTALVGYSMGGYGVLTAAGAPLDPVMASRTRGVLAPYVKGAAKAAALKVPNLKAVVAIAPAGGAPGLQPWTAPGVAAITAPTLYIVGSQDKAVGYDPGVRSLFEAQVHAPRYLLTFREAGHSIALTGAPSEARAKFWDFEWFEDAVWRKDRLLAVQAHFITAFLDRTVKGDEGKAAYMDGLVVDSNAGKWPDAPGGRYSGYSPGASEATLWKGFQPNKATGMSLEFKPAS
ncbi:MULTISPECIES: alpha/beta hydrolase family protein [Novosphingobium]|nr:dienelactone hydrolase [Novosphingobium resinovorum]